MAIAVTFDEMNKTFACKCSFEERDIPKNAGWFWSPITRLWETKKLSVAARLREYFDESAQKRFNNTSLEITPWSGSISIPKDQTLRPFQRQGAEFALKRNHSYLAFEQGLGKTPTAIAILNTQRVPALIICPPFLVDNWKRELSIWMVRGKVSEIGTAVDDGATEVVIVPDSLIIREGIQEWIKRQEFGLLIVDEAHRFKSHDAKRTMAFVNISKPIAKVVCLSGTPMPNRPAELFPILSSLAHNTIKFLNFHEYGKEFCGAYEHQHGWDYSGASNLPKLKKQIEPFMLRYTKTEMLKDLKPKEERVILLSSKKTKEIKKLENTIHKKFGEGVSNIIEKQNLGVIAEWRREVGMQKTQMAIDYIEDILETSDEQILVFAWHTDILTELLAKLSYASGLINGGTRRLERENQIREFQNGNLRVLIAQITTMVGYNLTKASRCIFVESSWSPADNAQAADRAHRIGQTGSVTIDYLVLSNSLDERIMNSVISKQKNINRAGLGEKGDTWKTK